MILEGLFVDGSIDIEVGYIICFYGEVGENYGLIILIMDVDVILVDCGVLDDVLIIELVMFYDVDFEILEGMFVLVIDVIVMS